MCLVEASVGPKAITLRLVETSREFYTTLPIGLVDEEVNHCISVLNKGNTCSESSEIHHDVGIIIIIYALYGNM